jgi:predicted DNA-binding transcriptional regulator AlpA
MTTEKTGVSDFLRLKNAAAKYQISTSMLYKLKQLGKLKFYKIGNISFVKSSEIEAIFEMGLHRIDVGFQGKKPVVNIIKTVVS